MSKVGEVTLERSEQRETILRVARHLGVTEYEVARRMDTSRNSLYSKLHMTGSLNSEDITAIAKALKVPKKVLSMSAVDAIQYLLDREKAKAP